MPPLAGRPASQYDLVELARVLRDVILRYEPRILAHTLKVSAEANKGDTHNVLGFRIEGQLWSQPIPLEIFMRTEIDLESGLTQVLENKAS
jgi:type VI secretion system protein ImpF